MTVHRPEARPARAPAAPRHAGARPTAPSSRPATPERPATGWQPKGSAKARSGAKVAAVAVKDASVSQGQVSRALVAAAKVRAEMLKDPARAQRAAAVLPEDLSMKVKAFHMAVTGGDGTGGRLVPAMARIGQTEGFQVVVRTLPQFKAELEAEYRAAKLDNVQVVTMQTPNPEGGDFWTEDQGDLDARGGVAVPALLRKGTQPPAWTGQDDVLKARQARGWKNPGAVGVVGAVGMRSAQESLAALAVATGRPLRVNLSHVEGGNQLTGTLKNGERYAVVGRDSVVVSAALLSRDLGRKVGVDEAKRAIAADLGIHPRNVFDIEQPGDFHVDMAMALLKPGQVLLNDARAALELQTGWLKDAHEKLKPLRKSNESPQSFAERMAYWSDEGSMLKDQLQALQRETRMRAQLEGVAEKELRAKGLEVVRAPAVFLSPHRPDLQGMNFLNGEGGVGERGRTFFVTQGGDPRAEKAFKAVLEDAVGPVRVHFLDRTLSALSLRDMGGISCRVRAEGTPLAG